ncbi:MAG: hypothetical protein A3F91_12385 [Flavobacteria bacterium RIFCSPLOWO2_12_FULL_35_11]|nr:MAG: hypothetical protein A3F91_12385 [Flavobacteria bacterium RIFCSPLOWO2_12_FULL_35_11]
MKNIIRSLADSEPAYCGGIEDNLNYFLTEYDNFTVLVKISLNQCTGLDSVFGSLGVEGVTKSLEVALRKSDVVFMDCVFWTIKWVEDWKRKGIRDKFNLYVIHLTTTNYVNLRRLSQRKAKKLGREDWWNIELPDTMYKHTIGKSRECVVIYDKLVKNNIAQDTIEIDAGQDEETINQLILTFINKNL